MSYCRFRNTVIDLRDCLDTLKYKDDGEEISSEEVLACREMFETFIDFCYDEGILDEEYKNVQERMEEFLQSLEK